MTDQAETTVDAFKGHVDQTFSVGLLDDDMVEMTLTSAQELPKENTVRENAPFVLEFQAPSGCPLNDGTYTVSNEAAGSHKLYLTVEGDNETTKKYHALFR